MRDTRTSDREMAYQFPDVISFKNRVRIARLSIGFAVLSVLIPILIIVLR